MMSPRAHPTLVLATVVLLGSLACSGLSGHDEPDVSKPTVVPDPAVAQPAADQRTTVGSATTTPARAAPSLVRPVDSKGTCDITHLPRDEVLSTFPGPCTRWSIAAHPNTPSDVLMTVGDAPARRGGVPLPALPEADDVDAVGFDTTGRVVGFTAVVLEPTLNDKTKTAFVTVQGKRVTMDYEDASMFGVVACRTYALDDTSWRLQGTPTAVQLFEGMASPFCIRVDGAPELTKLHQPGGDETRPVDARDITEVPPALAALSKDDFTSWTHVDDRLAAKVMFFEGARLYAPFARKTSDGWKVLEGLSNDEPAQMFRRDGFLLVCSAGSAHVYDARASYARVWTAQGQCPVFWPLDS